MILFVHTIIQKMSFFLQETQLKIILKSVPNTDFIKANEMNFFFYFFDKKLRISFEDENLFSYLNCFFDSSLHFLLAPDGGQIISLS